VNEPEAVVSVYDGGWLHGAGLFETMRAENGRVFRLESHLDRLRRSASKLLTELTRDHLPSNGSFAELLARNGLDSARVRLTVSAGSMRGRRDGAFLSPTVCATAAELSEYPTECYSHGVAVAVCDFRVSPSDPTAGHKTTGFLPRLLGLRQARQAGCTEALWFTTANRLAEGSISNVFVVCGGVLKTPPLDTPVLPGIARGIVLDVARRMGIETRECPLTINDLLDADEVLLTNAIMQVIPVIRVEKRDIGGGRIGPTAGRLLEEYRRLVQEECGRS
jgi:branched-subunit amino acid aminotransferase/4-amino-4-deoxychorismate lyase